MTIETAKLLEGVAANKEGAPCKRAFASGVLLMSYDSLRISDVQRLETFDVNSDSIRGTLIQFETKKPHGMDWPWACPRMGMAGPLDWALPLIDFRTAYTKRNGSEHSFAAHRVNRAWELDSSEAPHPPILYNSP